MLNGGFEQDTNDDGVPDGWTKHVGKLPWSARDALALDRRTAHSGGASLRISFGGEGTAEGASWCSPTCPVTGGKWLLAGVWAKGRAFAGRPRVLYWFGTKDSKRSCDAWQIISLSLTKQLRRRHLRHL